MARINERIKSDGAPLPHNPRKNAAPSSQTSTNIAINEAKSLPDPEGDKHLAPAPHPQVAYDGSGGRAHRVSSGVPR